MKVVIEFEGFKLKSKFCFKELSICELDTGICSHFFIKPNKNYYQLSPKERKNVTYCERNLHGIYWRAGIDRFQSVQSYVNNLVKEGAVVYTKGFEKVQILEKSFVIPGPILDFNELNLEFFNSYEGVRPCPLSFHKNSSHCSHYKAQVLAKILEDNQDESLHEQEPQLFEEDIQMSATEEETTH